MDNSFDIKQLVRGLRQLKLTQEEIAKGSGVKRSTVRNLLHKKRPIRRPRIDTFQKLSEYLQRVAA